MHNLRNQSCDKMLFYGLPEHGYKITWDIIDGLMFFPTVLGNSLILLSIYRFRKLRTKIYILIGNLAANDLLVGVTLLPLETLGHSAGLDTNANYCLIKLSVFALTLGGSVLGLLLISLERFSAVAFPLRHAYFTKRKLAIVLACGWVYIAFVTLSPLFGCNNISDNISNDVEEIDCNASVVWGEWCRFSMHVNLILALFLNMILYLTVVVIAFKKAREHGEQTGTGNNHFRSREMSKTFTMAAVLGIFALFWMPYAIMTILIEVYHGCVSEFYSIRRWGLLIGLLNCSINWIIYGLRNKDFKEAFLTILKCDKKRFQRSRRVTCSTLQPLSLTQRNINSCCHAV